MCDRTGDLSRSRIALESPRHHASCGHDAPRVKDLARRISFDEHEVGAKPWGDPSRSFGQALGETVYAIEIAGKVDDEGRSVRIRLPRERVGEYLDR
jgi:hypothetical protein